MLPNNREKGFSLRTFSFKTSFKSRINRDILILQSMSFRPELLKFSLALVFLVESLTSIEQLS